MIFKVILYFCNHYNFIIITEMEVTMEAVTLLKRNDIRPSHIRILAIEYLQAHHTHPTAQEVYLALSKKLPTLSQTSVYNTLHLLAKNHIISEVTIDPEKVRYDYNTELHGHFKCECCSNVWDFAVNNVQTSLSQEFDIKTKEIYFTGLCEKCKN